MFARLFTRAPITATRAVRFNSSSSSSSAARVFQMAAQAERPSMFPPDGHHSLETVLTMVLDAAEAAVPVMWAVCGALTYTAWNRMDERNAGDAEKLLIV